MSPILEKVLFPKSRFMQFIGVIVLSCVFSFSLIGKQAYQANWGLIDDHEIFTYLGSDLRLPPSEIWNTLLAKTEVGQPQGRFRPTFYLFKVIEASIFGDNVHFWYLVNALCFAVFLSSIWWGLSRFVGSWLGGALTAAIALLPLWSDIWSRLGPSEIFGAACVGLILFAADAALFAERSAVRNAGAVSLALLAIVLAGLKETFLPLAGGSVAFVFLYAVVRKKLSVALVAALSLLVITCLAALSFVVFQQLRSSGADFYGKSAGPWIILAYGAIGTLDGFARTWWLWILPIILFQMLEVVPRQSLMRWISGSMTAFGVYIFLIAMYAAQCGMYRMLFPHNDRYDFPAMLLVPLTCCVLLSDVACKLRKSYPDRIVNYAQLAAAIFLICALVNGNLGRPPSLAIAVKKNIEVTNAFFNEVRRLVEAAHAAPTSPIIVEAGGPRSFEGVYSLAAFVTALGAQNPISVRYHPDERFKGPLYDALQRQLVSLEAAQNDRFTPLARALADRSRGCLSVGLYTSPDASCSGFKVGDDPKAISN